VNAIWPLFTIPFFDVATHHFLDATGAKFMAFSPIIMADDDNDDNETTTRGKWEAFTTVANNNNNVNDTNTTATVQIPPSLHDFDGPIPQNQSGPFIPIWQIHPQTSGNVILNLDLQSFPVFSQAYIPVHQGKQRMMSGVVDFDAAPQFPGSDQLTEPHSFLIEPVFDGFMMGGGGGGDDDDDDDDDNPHLVGVLTTLLPLDFFLRDLLPADSERVYAVIRDSCGASYTYAIVGPDTQYLGQGDLHDKSYNYLKVSTPITANIRSTDVERIPCELFMDIYPSHDMEDRHSTNNPKIYTGIIMAIFLGTLAVFLMYETSAQRRMKSVMDSAIKTTRILAGLFPSNVHERLFRSGRGDASSRNNHHHAFATTNTNDGKNPAGNEEAAGGAAGTSNKTTDAHHLKDFMGEGKKPTNNGGGGSHAEVVNGMYTTLPIADLFPNTTIFFADITGFSTWSSNREPTQVFILLETVFRAFDAYANRRDVFKVETVGDCYVAVTGLPNARSDHAVVMAKFAKDCLCKMNKLSLILADSLGSETRDLKLRVGLHSGPVIAGVLRGEKSRFQLFGDSMNTTARIETSGAAGSIHLSQDTAELLISAGHSKWVFPRKDLVTAKGKGVMRTYWLQLPDRGSSHASRSQCSYSMCSLSNDSISEAADIDSDDSDIESDDEDFPDAPLFDLDIMEIEQKPRIPDDSPEFLVEWSVDVLLGLLRQVIAKREKAESILKKSGSDLEISFSPENSEDETDNNVEEIDASNVDVGPAVESQLHTYVLMISTMYRDHGFHNFEHASHVMLSITKLITRITSPNREPPPESAENGGLKNKINGMLNNYSYGIASDPLLMFAVAFAALIHDVDHAGVPNTRLVKEDVNLAKKYRYKSVAEKHSIRLVWERLMDAEFRELRSCLCPTQLELKRFRNFVVNAVMATDLADKELNDKRNERWNECFDDWPEDPSEDDIQRKATIIIEHLMQAADVAHTMQNFEVFKKWNERLFYERFTAYDSARADEDPSKTWCEEELKFFDFFVIPLAQKLGTCGVAGLESLEFLNYAQDNRQKWAVEGVDMVENWRLQYYEKKLEKSA
jgi:class 3 adenylate cyclase